MREADWLIEQLKTVNQELLSVDPPDPARIAQAVERRGQLLTRVGHLLRDSARAASSLDSSTSPEFRARLDHELETGESALRRILSSAAHQASGFNCIGS